MFLPIVTTTSTPDTSSRSSGSSLGRVGEDGRVDVGVDRLDRADRPDALHEHRDLAVGEGGVAVVVRLAAVPLLRVAEELVLLLQRHAEVLLEGDGRIGPDVLPLLAHLVEEVALRRVGADGVERGQPGPRVRERAVERRDAGILQRVAHGDELVPGLGHLQPLLLEDLLVVDDAVRVVHVAEAVDLALLVAEVGEDLLHGRVDRVEHRLVGEVVEHARLREPAEAAVGVQRDDVGRLVLHEQGADDRVGVGDLVLHDLDVGVLGLEVLDDLREVLERLALELEEVERDDVAVAGRRAAREQQAAEGDGGCRGERSPWSRASSPMRTPAGGLIRHDAPPCAFGVLRWCRAVVSGGGLDTR